jgi:hypothetical protein
MSGFMSKCFICGGQYYYQPAVTEKYDMGGSTVCPICAEAGAPAQAQAQAQAPASAPALGRAKWVVRP